MIALYWLYAVLALAFSPTSYAFAITGLQGGVNVATGERPIRQEISVFQYAGAAFDLYILALQQFMEQDQTDQFSYYQIAGRPAGFSAIEKSLQSSQGFMAILTHPGMALSANSIMDIVLMGLSCFLHGTALIWRCLR